MVIRAILGLGNPGIKYAYTRHNIGFMVLDLLANKHNLKWEQDTKEYKTARLKFRNEVLILCKPMTYMNNSGVALMELCQQYDLNINQVLVVMDDFNLDFGQLRIRKSGTDGGHNGLASIIYHTETEAFPRLRIGIGSPPEDAIDFVLSTFSELEQEKLQDILNMSVDAIEFMLSKGIEKGMGIYNRKINKEPIEHTDQQEGKEKNDLP